MLMPRLFKITGVALVLFTCFGSNLLTPAARAAGQQSETAGTSSEIARGKQLYEQGDTKGAIAQLRAVAEKRKNDADAWYYLGFALNRAGRAKEGRKAFEKAVKLRPDASAYVGLAYSLLLLNKMRDAEREARRALSLDPQFGAARYVVGVVRFREEKFTEAALEAEEALRLNPSFAAAAYLNGDALLSIYVDESERQSHMHPLAVDLGETERKSILEKREMALEPIKARLTRAAELLETFVKSQPNDPAAAQWHEQVETLRVYGHAGSMIPGVFRQSEVTERATIISKPEPGYTDAARNHNVTGVVRLRVVLAADGRVKNALVIKRLPDGLTENAIAAARRIKFKPATVNGVPVSLYVTLEYNFNIY